MLSVRRVASLLLVAALAVFTGKAMAQVVIPEGAVVLQDRWYVMKINGHRAGWQHEVMYRSAAERIVTASASKLSIRRGKTTVDMLTSHRFEETLDFKPIQAEMSMNAGAEPVRQVMAFQPDGSRELLVEHGKHVFKNKLPKIGFAWHTPGRSEKVIREALHAGQETVVVRMIDLSVSPEPSKMVMKVQG